MTQKIVNFDATELDNFDACHFKWHAIHHMHLQPKTTKDYFEKGILLHYLLELYYKQVLNHEAIDLEKIVEAGRMKSLEFELDLGEVAEHLFQFREYVRYYEDENIIPLYVEEPFMVKIHEDADLIVMLSGKPDLIFKYRGSNSLAVMDHKRVSRESQISPLRNQFLLYTTALQTDTMIVNKVGFQKTKKPAERFLRTPFIYNEELQEEWKLEVIEKAREMIICEDYGHYQRNRSSCEKWDGCFFQRYCSTRPSAREFLIGSEYIVGETWDVSKRLEVPASKEG